MPEFSVHSSALMEELFESIIHRSCGAGGEERGRDVAPPDLKFGLLHQKLQMLNYCIAQQNRLRSKRAPTTSKVKLSVWVLCATHVEHC